MTKQRIIIYFFISLLCLLSVYICIRAVNQSIQKEEKITNTQGDIKNNDGASQIISNYEQFETEQGGVYDLTTMIDKADSVIAAGMGAYNNVILVKETHIKSGVERQITSLSLNNGAEEVLSTETYKSQDEDIYPGKVKIISIDPLIIYDSYNQVANVYSENYVVNMRLTGEGLEDSAIAYRRNDNCLYYEIENTQRIKKANLVNVAQWCNDNGNYNVKLDDFGEDVCRGPKGIIYMTIAGISGDGNSLQMSGWDDYLDKYIFFDYDLENNIFGDKYVSKEDYFPKWKNVENSIVFFTEQVALNTNYYLCRYNENKYYYFDTSMNEVSTEYNMGLYIDKYSISYDNVLMMFYDTYSHSSAKIFLWNLMLSKSYVIDDSIPRWNYEISPLENKNELNEQLTKRKEAIEDKYGIYIYTGNQIKEEINGYYMENADDSKLISSAIYEIEKAFDSYPEGFIEELISSNISGINIYLTGEILPYDEEKNIVAAAVTFERNGYQCIALDINREDVKKNLIHEMCHVIENILKKKGEYNDLEKAWNLCNPEGFKYQNSYIVDDDNVEYTSLDELYWENNDNERVYFFDTYAKTFSKEDRARTMENFVEYNELDLCYESPHMQAKVTVYMEFLRANFESFRNAKYGLWVETYNKLMETGKIKVGN